MSQKYVYGPVPSRRMGLSLGVSPIPKKTCNYSCIYCQLGRTNPLTNERRLFFPVEEILKETGERLKHDARFDVVTIVGEGEPTLYLGLEQLILGIKALTNKPVAVITNGALLYEHEVQKALMHADIVLPSLDAWNEDSFKWINRPHGQIEFLKVIQGLEEFSRNYKGQLWIEMMFLEGINDTEEAIQALKKLVEPIRYDRLYLNTPVRPPAESFAKPVSSQKMEELVGIMGGISIDLLSSVGFQSDCQDHQRAILSIIARHPMNQFEIETFLLSRGCSDPKVIIESLRKDPTIECIPYKGYYTYRLG